MTQQETARGGAAIAGADAPAAAVVVHKRGISYVWIIPVIAILVGAYVAWQVLSSRGPEITISFLTAEGIEAGKTQVKFKDVAVGLVEDVTIAKDLSRVICRIRMAAGANAYLRESTRFWIVKPRVAAGQVSGLNTLLSGAYIAIDPVTKGKTLRSFVGLEVPPIVSTAATGRYFVLRSNTTGAMAVGAPIYFRKFPAGQVVSSTLDNTNYITTRVFISAPYDKRVTTNARFWIASGIDLTLGADGVQIDAESVATILAGGLAFDQFGIAGSNATESEGSPAPAETVFNLFPNPTLARKPSFTRTVKYVLLFDGSVRGLHVGSPVEFRGIPVGEVEEMHLQFDRKTGRFLIPVVVKIQPDLLGIPQVSDAERRETVNRLIAAGLRAQLKSGNLLTGQLVVYLDVFKNAKAARANWSGKYAEIPTIPSTVAEITDSLTVLADRLSKVPVDQIGKDLAESIQELKKALASAQGIGPALTKTLEAVNKTLESTNALIAPDSSVNYELRRSLLELSDAARALGLAADQFQAQPDSVIFGKKGDK